MTLSQQPPRGRCLLWERSGGLSDSLSGPTPGPQSTARCCHWAIALVYVNHPNIMCTCLDHVSSRPVLASITGDWWKWCQGTCSLHMGLGLETWVVRTASCSTAPGDGRPFPLTSTRMLPQSSELNREAQESHDTESCPSTHCGFFLLPVSFPALGIFQYGLNVN